VFWLCYFTNHLSVDGKPILRGYVVRKSRNNVVLRNRKVATLRGERWKLRLKEGWLDSQMNPTRLKIARVSKGLSQWDISKLSGLSFSTYGGIERGLRPARTEYVESISKSLGAAKTQFFKEISVGRYITLR
jgi:DNA-binding XRE family transcriptional regulator